LYFGLSPFAVIVEHEGFQGSRDPKNVELHGIPNGDYQGGRGTTQLVLKPRVAGAGAEIQAEGRAKVEG